MPRGPIGDICGWNVCPAHWFMPSLGRWFTPFFPPLPELPRPRTPSGASFFSFFGRRRFRGPFLSALVFFGRGGLSSRADGAASELI